MTKRIFRTILIVAVCVLLAAVVLFMTILYDYFSAVGQNQLRTQLDLASQGVINEGAGYFDGLDAKNYRITWIGTNGRCFLTALPRRKRWKIIFSVKK